MRIRSASDAPEQSGPLLIPLFGLLVLASVVAWTCSGPAALAAAGETQYAKPISNRLNVTGRAIDLPVPLKDGDRPLGDILVRIDPDDKVFIHKSGLVEKLAPVLLEAVRARLEAVQSQAGLVALQALAAAGFDVRFDPGLQELVFRVSVDQRPAGDISLGYPARPRISANLARPAIIAGYLNVIAGIDRTWGGTTIAGPNNRADDATFGRLEFDSAVRLWNVVIENRAIYKTGTEISFCPVTIYCRNDDTAGFRRDISRIAYDQPEKSLRLTIGDVDSLGIGIQGSPEMLGVSLEKSPRKLNPGVNNGPTMRSSFRIDRPSQVEVLVNGIVLNRLQLRPGIYNIRDLPLATGANEVQLEITDDTGERRTQSFRTFFDNNLLAAGNDEWSLTAGVPSFLLNEQRMYSDDQVLGIGHYRYGLTNSLTAEAHLQADTRIAMGGAGAIMQSPWGVFAVRGAVSGGYTGAGAAATFDWSLVNFTGITGTRGENLRLSAEYRTADYRVPGEVVTTADGLLYLQPNYRARFDASYSAPLAWGVSATLAGRYLMVDDDDVWHLPYVPRGDRYGADLTLSRALGPTLSLSLTLGYSNESYLASVLGNREVEPEFRIAARLYFRPDVKTTVSASYDSLNQQADISAYRSEGNGIGRWDVSVNAQHHGAADRGSLGGSASYHGNRADLRVAHSTGLSGISYDSFDGRVTGERTSLRVGSSIAFADGLVAVGAPIRGNAFALVHPHDSIATREVIVGSGQNIHAKANSLGPGVVTGLPAYLPGSIAVDVADLPIGYSLGAAAFDTFAPYKAGYRLEVGSAYSVYAYGTLLLGDGAPVALLTGIARQADEPAREVAIFTNAAGKFGAEGLAPGKWTIEIATPDTPTLYAIDIPAGTDGLFKAGTLRPLGPT